MVEAPQCINCSFRELKKLDDLNCMFLGEDEDCDNPLALKLVMPSAAGKEEPVDGEKSEERVSR
jgi:hypothetical protein